jgi:hypothetical protein
MILWHFNYVPRADSLYITYHSILGLFFPNAEKWSVKFTSDICIQQVQYILLFIDFCSLLYDTYIPFSDSLSVIIPFYFSLRHLYLHINMKLWVVQKVVSFPGSEDQPIARPLTCTYNYRKKADIRGSSGILSQCSREEGIYCLSLPGHCDRRCLRLIF